LPLLPGVLLLAFRGATDRSGLPVMGHSEVSAAVCVGTILMVSVLVLVGLRRDLRAVEQRSPFAFKIAGTLALACGGFFLFVGSQQTLQTSRNFFAPARGDYQSVSMLRCAMAVRRRNWSVRLPTSWRFIE
jgi:hypothetical protein